MRDIPTPRERTEQSVSSDDLKAISIAIPPIEDLYEVVTDPTDFMSAQSFPASDPPSWGHGVKIVDAAHGQTEENSGVLHAPHPCST